MFSLILGLLLLSSSAQAAVLDVPTPQTTLSGVGVIHGWKCDAGDLTVRFDGDPPLPLLHGAARLDVLHAGACDSAQVGFVSIMNWGELGDGHHTAIVYDNGVEFARSTFTVSSPGMAFLRNLMGRGEAVLSNGQRAMLVWAEATQGFEAVAFTDPPDEGICTTRMAPARYTSWDGTIEQTAQVTVTNPCDGVTLDFTVVSETEEFYFNCSDLILVQPPTTVKRKYDAHTYAGHGYGLPEETDVPYGPNGYVTLHQPGNRGGICHDLAAGETKSFRISVDPERVDNPLPFNFLEPFQVYYGDEDNPDDPYTLRVTADHLLVTFP